MCVCLNIHASKNVSKRIYKKMITLVWCLWGRGEGKLGVKGRKEISYYRYLYLSNVVTHIPIQQTNIK